MSWQANPSLITNRPDDTWSKESSDKEASGVCSSSLYGPLLQPFSPVTDSGWFASISTWSAWTWTVATLRLESFVSFWLLVSSMANTASLLFAVVLSVMSLLSSPHTPASSLEPLEQFLSLDATVLNSDSIWLWLPSMPEASTRVSSHLELWSCSLSTTSVCWGILSRWAASSWRAERVLWGDGGEVELDSYRIVVSICTGFTATVNDSEHTEDASPFLTLSATLVSSSSPCLSELVSRNSFVRESQTSLSSTGTRIAMSPTKIRVKFCPSLFSELSLSRLETTVGCDSSSNFTVEPWSEDGLGSQDGPRDFCLISATAS